MQKQTLYVWVHILLHPLMFYFLLLTLPCTVCVWMKRVSGNCWSRGQWHVKGDLMYKVSTLNDYRKSPSLWQPAPHPAGLCPFGSATSRSPWQMVETTFNTNKSIFQYSGYLGDPRIITDIHLNMWSPKSKLNSSILKRQQLRDHWMALCLQIFHELVRASSEGKTNYMSTTY